MIARLAALFVFGLAWAVATPPAADAQQQPKLALPCAECHGVDGISPHTTVPNLAGQKWRYLAQQLKNFRKAAKGDFGKSGLGGRRHPKMETTADPMGDAEIEALAVDYSVLRCGGGATGAAPMPLIANRCAACHGAKGVSPLGTVPNLAGQKQSYLVKQLAYFRDAARGLGFGDKESRYHAMMDSQGRRLDDMNLYALARYYAKLPCR